MKHLKQFLILALFAIIGVGQMWAVEVKDTIPIVRFNGTSGNSYVSSSTGTTNKGIGATVGNFIPNSGQMKVNQGNTSSLNASNFYVYNTQAMPGSITKIELVVTEGTVTNNYCQVTVSTSSACSSNPTYNTSNAVSGTSTRSKTFTAASGYQYFRISWAKNGGTVKASYVVITYEKSSSTKPTVSFGLEAGTYCGTQSVTLSSDVQGATIYYTTNGTTPTISSSVYSSAISVSSTTTIKAFAKKDSNTGDVAQAAYTINSPVNPTITFNNGSVDEGSTLNLSTLFTSNSEGAVTYSITEGGSYASLSGSTLSGVAAGSVTVQASQAADGCYNAKTQTATITVQEHVVTPGTYNVTLNNALFGSDASGSLSGGALHDYTGQQNDITFDYVKGSGSNMYMNANQIRLYNNVTLVVTAPAGFNITEVTGLVANIASNVGSISSNTWTGKSNSITFSYTQSSGNAQLGAISVTYEAEAPEVTVDPSSLSFTAKQNIAVAGKTFTLEGANLESGLTLAASAGYSVSPTSITAQAAMAQGGVEVTVTPVTPTTTTTPVEGTITISGGGLASNVVVNLSMAVTPTYAVALAVNDNTMGSATINGGTASIYVTEDDEIALVATPESGHEFVNWTVSDDDIVLDDENAASTTALAAAAGTITANFQAQACTGLAAPTKEEDNVTVTYSSATIAWNTVANAAGYVLNLKKHEGNVAVVTDEIIVAPAVSFEKTGLEANTQYDYSIMAIGDGTAYCDESNPLLEGNFTTNDYPSVTVTYSENGNSVSGGTKKILTPFDLPNGVTNNVSGKTFVGWTTKSDFADGDESLASYHAKGTKFTIESNAAVTLYAVYATAGGSAASSWQLTYEDIDKLGSGTGYVAYDGEHEKSGISFTTSNVMVGSNPNQEKIQFKASVGLLYNSDAFSADIESIVVTDVDLAVYQGTEAIESTPDGDPIEASGSGPYTYTFASGKRYFHIKKANSGAGYVTSITVNLAANVTYSGYVISGTPVLPQVATPTFTVAEGEYAEAQSVEIECATTGATIYYTTNGTEPSTSSTEYTSAISLSNRGDYTIKAIAVMSGCDNSEIASADYTINPPFATVADLFTYVGESTTYNLGQVTVTGYVSEIVTEYSSTYYNVTYNISDDGKTTSAQLQSYRGLGVKTGEDVYEDADLVAVGDKVTITGTYKVHNSTKELDANNYIITRVAKGAVTGLAVSGTAAKTTYVNGESFETTGLVATATYASGYQAAVTPDSWAASPATVTATGNVAVTATVGAVTSPAYNVAVSLAAKTLVSIAVGTASYTIYTGQALPQPTVTATYSEGEPEDVSALATYDSESVFDTEVIDNPDPQTITVSYTFGGATRTATYTVSVKDYANDAAHPYTVAEAIDIITNVIGTTVSARNIYVQGIVSQKSNPSSNTQTYYISDDGTTTNHLEIYKGKYIGGANFTNDNQVLVGDEVVVGGKVKMFNSKAEFDENSELQSLARTPNFEIADVASFEVGTADKAVADLTITKDGAGAVTIASSNHTEYVDIVDGKLRAVAAGTATITANLAANGIYKAATADFNVTVIAAQTKYTISFDSNGADGGTAPTAIADKAAGANVTLPENTWTKEGYNFDGWKVTYVDGDEEVHEVAVAANAFIMPAFNVTIQAQWAEISEWATVYTSESGATLSTTGGTSASEAKVVYSATQYDAIKAGTGSVYGAIKVTVPAQTTKLHYHAYGWNGETVTLNITAPTGVTVSPATQAINSNSGISSNSPFTLSDGANPATDAYYAVALSGNTQETTLTFTATGGKRFVLFGVNQEGGVVPVLDHIVVSGELTNKDYELGDNLDTEGLTVTAYYTLADEPHHNEDVTSSVAWSNDPLTGGQTSVDVTATYEGKSHTLACAINAVVVPEPEIVLSESELAFSGKQYTPVADQTFDVQLKNVAAATIAISGDDAAKFSIDETSLTANGTITVSANTDAAGSYSATITVSDNAGDADPQTVALTLTVTADEAPAWNAEWIEATELYDGMPILITGVNTTTSKIYAMGAQGDNNRAAVEGSLSGDVFTPGAGTKQFTLEKQDNGTYAIKTTDGKYLYAASSSKNYLRTQVNNDNNGKWTLTTASAVANGTNTNNNMKFNSSASVFSCYGSGQTAIQLYTPRTYKRTISGNIGTICLPYRVEEGDYSGATFYRVMYKKGDPDAPNYVQLEEVGALEAGRPYIFVPNDQENESVLRAIYRNKEAVANSEVNDEENNGLYGTFSQVVKDGTSELIYILNSNKIRRCGTNCTVGANKAYILMDEVPAEQNAPAPAPGRRQMMLLNGDIHYSPTGMENVQTDDVQCIKIFRNGNMYILRGDKMYDVMGKTVK